MGALSHAWLVFHALTVSTLIVSNLERGCWGISKIILFIYVICSSIYSHDEFSENPYHFFTLWYYGILHPDHGRQSVCPKLLIPFLLVACESESKTIRHPSKQWYCLLYCVMLTRIWTLKRQSISQFHGWITHEVHRLNFIIIYWLLFFCCYQWNIHKPYLVSSDIFWCYINQLYMFSGEHRHLFPVKPLCPWYEWYVAALSMVCGTVSDVAEKGNEMLSHVHFTHFGPVTPDGPW